MKFFAAWIVFVIVGMAAFLIARSVGDSIPKNCSWCQPNQPMYGADR